VTCFFEFPRFPFWCLDAKGGGGRVYLFILWHLLCFLGLACKTFSMLSRSCGHVF
jgi:hypothetical protein